MILATSFLVTGVTKGLRLLINGSRFDSFRLLKCALKLSLMRL